jgi:hypothetical protein
MARAASLYTQKPLAFAGMAWCRPPAKFTACRVRPAHRSRAIAPLAPAIAALASCIPSKTGTSSVPRP